jgi:hypothetical protein
VILLHNHPGWPDLACTLASQCRDDWHPSVVMTGIPVAWWLASQWRDDWHPSGVMTGIPVAWWLASQWAVQADALQAACCSCTTGTTVALPANLPLLPLDKCMALKPKLAFPAVTRIMGVCVCPLLPYWRLLHNLYPLMFCFRINVTWHYSSLGNVSGDVSKYILYWTPTFGLGIELKWKYWRRDTNNSQCSYGWK